MQQEKVFFRRLRQIDCGDHGPMGNAFATTLIASAVQRSIRLALCFVGISLIALPLVNSLPAEAAPAKKSAKQSSKEKQKAGKKSVRKNVAKSGSKRVHARHQAGKKPGLAKKGKPRKQGKAVAAKKPGQLAKKGPSLIARPPARSESMLARASAPAYRPSVAMPVTPLPARTAEAAVQPTMHPLTTAMNTKAETEPPSTGADRPPNEAKAVCRRNGKLYMMADCDRPIPSGT
jgi:hypothetical protein